jgi:hypothetical protein
VGEGWSACHFVDEMDSATRTVSEQVGLDIRVGRE